MKTSLLTALLLTATTAHAQASIVVNGGFEEPKLNQPWAVLPTITGWRTVSGPGPELQAASVGWRPQAGAQMVELDSTAPTSIAQDLTTRPGGVYELSLSFSPRPSVADNRIGVYWNGQQLAVLEASGAGASATNWKRFTYRVSANGSQTELRFTDLSNRDGVGGLIDDVQVISQDSGGVPDAGVPDAGMPGGQATAEQLWLENQSNTPITSKTVLEQGKPYRLTMQGTYSMWQLFTTPSNKAMKPEPTPMFPSAKGENKLVGLDPEFYFSWPYGSALGTGTGAAPRRSGLIEFSLDGGKTWKHPASTAPFNATEHKYTYELTGEGNALQVRNIDKPAGDNYGRVQITVQPGT